MRGRSGESAEARWATRPASSRPAGLCGAGGAQTLAHHRPPPLPLLLVGILGVPQVDGACDDAQQRQLRVSGVSEHGLIEDARERPGYWRGQLLGCRASGRRTRVERSVLPRLVRQGHGRQGKRRQPAGERGKSEGQWPEWVRGATRAKSSCGGRLRLHEVCVLEKRQLS